MVKLRHGEIKEFVRVRKGGREEGNVFWVKGQK
jgi:hypothetical protein